MALQSSGAISANDINVELGYSGTATITLNDSAARTLAGIASGQISFSDFYGKSASVDIWFGSIRALNTFEGSNNTEANSYTDSSSKSTTIFRTTSNTGSYIKWKNTAYPYSTVNIYPSSIPPAQGGSSPFLPSDYWGIRCVTTAANGYTNYGTYSFYQAPNYSSYGYVFAGNVFTLEFFYKPDEEGLQYDADINNAQFQGNGWIVGMYDNNNYQNQGIVALIRNNTFTFAQGYMGGSVFWGGKIESGAMLCGSGKWYHCCVQVNYTSASMYIDGIKVGSVSSGYTYTNWYYTHILANPPAGNISQLRLVGGSLVYSEDSNGNITVPTSALGDISGTQILTACGPQLKNYASAGTVNFGSVDTNYIAQAVWHSTPVPESPFVAKTTYSKTSHSGSIFFNPGVSNYPQILSTGTGGSTGLGDLGNPTISSGDFTIETWFKRITPQVSYQSGNSGQSTWVPLAFLTNNGYWWGGLYIDGDTASTVRWYHGEGTSTETVYNWTNGYCNTVNQWTHIALVFKRVSGTFTDGYQVYLFMNGAIQKYNGSIVNISVNNCKSNNGGGNFGTRNLVIGGMPKWSDSTAGNQANYNYSAATPFNYYGPGAPFLLSNLRISSTARYAVTGSFTPSSSPFTSDSNTIFLLRGENTSSGIPDGTYTNHTGSYYCNLSTAQAKSGSSSLQFPSSSSGADPYATIQGNSPPSYFDRTFYTVDEGEAWASNLKNFYVANGSLARNSYAGRAYGAIYSNSTNYYLNKKFLQGGFTLEFNFYVPSSEISFYTSVTKILTGYPYSDGGYDMIGLTRTTSTSSTLTLSPYNNYSVFESYGSAATSVTTNAWHHVAIVGWGLEKRWYLDGTYIGKSSFPNSGTPAQQLMPSTWGIGFSGVFTSAQEGGYSTGGSGNTKAFRGYIDNFRYYSLPRYIGNASTGFTPPSSLLSGPSTNLYPVRDTNSSKVAIGGEIFDAGGYRYHVFTKSGRLINGSANAITCDIICIGGGGAGGSGADSANLGRDGGGGGGAGGYKSVSGQSLAANGTFTVYVGAGGTPTTYYGGDGGSSYVVGSSGTITGGGGGGGGGAATTNGRNGLTVTNGTQGSGGGGGYAYSGGSGSYAGGSGARIYNTYLGMNFDGGGGGGGVGSAGANAHTYDPLDGIQQVYGGSGGTGATEGIAGLCIQYGGGGGGYGTNNGGAGGQGDTNLQTAGNGGNWNLGDPYNTWGNSKSATRSALWGGGGGGGAYGYYYASGGFQGIVIIRYAI